MIDVRQFCKAYENSIAVRDLSFQVQPGQVLGLIGPNGAGKTTTMRAISGIIPSSSGRLSVSGFDVQQQPIAVKQETAYVPDDPQLFNDLTVAQHFALVASLYQIDWDWQAEMKCLLEMFELTNKIDTKASDLSRGMRQKLALGCAYLYRPNALLLDEPMTGLDPRGIRVLKETLQKRAEQGTAIIISSHLLAMVEDICSHVLILREGQRQFYGTIAELRDTFATDRQTESTLEDIFFKAVEEESAAPLPIVDMGGLSGTGGSGILDS